MFKKILWINFLCLIIVGQIVYSTEAQRTVGNYKRLLEFIRLEDIDSPVFMFSDFKKQFDKKSHLSNIDYFRNHPDLLQKIKKDLDSELLQLRIENFEERLLFVPELREEYASLYERYCNHLVNYVLKETQLSNPFKAIQTLTREKPQIPEVGVTAFLVHDLEKEYAAKYSFSNEHDKKVIIKLSGKVQLGMVGSYTSTLSYADNGDIEFIRDSYTIWQNSAANPFTALMVPAEETLHIALRTFTENAIRTDLRHLQKFTPSAVEKVVEDWIEVEEAVVGGIVHILIKNFLVKNIPGMSPDLIHRDLRTKSSFERYSLLESGVEVVKNMGTKESVKVYAESPWKFKKLLNNALSSS